MNGRGITLDVNRIPLGCKYVDALLGGGIEAGSVTLFYGEA